MKEIGQGSPDQPIIDRYQVDPEGVREELAKYPVKGFRDFMGQHGGRQFKEGREAWYDRPHEELVKGFRDFIQYEQGKYLRVLGSRASPEETIGIELSMYKALSGLSNINVENEEERKKNDKQEKAFWTPISAAWDVLTHARYKPGSIPEHDTGMHVPDHYNRTREPVIKLSDPQVRMLDALAEAAGIPHERGQKEIEIPERLRDYENWVTSEEYEELVDQAQARK
jgi:hypothetical protein